MVIFSIYRKVDLYNNLIIKRRVAKVMIRHIQNSLDQADLYQSKITDHIVQMSGMTGKKTRHLYNNICSIEDARYLEIGTWKGSSICSAMCDNCMTCLCVDNWSQYGGPKEEFLINFNRYKGENNATFLEKNCWDIDTEAIGKFNIYMYDGEHLDHAHFKALDYFLPSFDNEFIFIVDDWNWENVRKETLESIEHNSIEILWKKEIFTKSINRKEFEDWHNGISVLLLKKN